jgi:hypothetical protein
MRQRFVLATFLICACAPAATTTSDPSPGSPDRVIAVDDRIGTSIRAPNDIAATRITLNATADQVFDAVTSTYAMLKIPITYADKNSGEQGNKKFVMSRTFDREPVASYLNCGDDPFGGPNANANPVNVSIVTRARASGGTGTVLETTITGVTYKSSGSTGPIYCGTTGALETHIAEMVRSRVPGAQ